ncbi:hypothetical protein [uncultured Kordia sp.]|uniref:tetratricopeptide repeat protein n=1 Tax=uncultured Kordia sp. TaxID=507699 RepID=UPI00261DCF48|nr:hypothetical protein [uncultured Kordia sp.]
MNTEEFIQDYIANRLSDEDKARAEELLQTDTEFRELYESHLELTAAFKISNDKALKKRLQELDANTTTVSTKKLNTGIIRRIAIAAIFIIGAFFAINQFTAEGDVFDTYFEVCPNTYLPVTRGTATQDVQSEAFKVYESGDYQKAAKAFKDLLATKNNLNIRFYYAMSLLNQEKYDLALNELNSLAQHNFDYQVETFWYAALIHIKKEDNEAARGQLEKLQQLNPNYKSDEIKVILEKLK